MPNVQRSTVVNAPAEKVYALLTDPSRYAEFGAGLKQIEQEGNGFKATYSAMGQQFPITFQIVDSAAPNRLRADFSGGLNGSWNWALSPDGNGTRIDLDLDYQVPESLQNQITYSLMLQRANEKNSERTLESLKSIAERG